ncbi:Late embryogenesis abundant protein [Melia azedarach]|uniref:Late embryogenesis abundant protein n=1 Tax=Melia azedarach TaxID=155640 RepID=A0ACC1WY78_MELAZ|nr:Late embryogenesis abundant protein [Melia azedarach]
MDVQSKKEAAAAKPVRSHRKRNICIGVTLTIVGIVLLIVILALTVFKARRPVMNINSVSLEDLDVSLDMARMRVNLNVTLDVSLSIRNPNKVGFKYKNSSAFINYRGDVVGDVPIPAGRISADKTSGMNLTVTLLADRLLGNSQLFPDVMGGSLPLSTKAKISGKVNILGIKIKVTSTSTCAVTVFISNRTISDQSCKYKTQL